MVVPLKPKMPTVPIPVHGNVDSVHDTLMALKQVAERLMGTRGNEPVTRTFVQEAVPTAFVVGDQWIQPSTGHLSYWNGSNWQLTKGAP